jgi:hypothetical protein
MMGLSWLEANQAYLMAALAEVRKLLKQRCERIQKEAPGKETVDQESPGEIAEKMTAPPSLENLCHTFGLSPFERLVLLLCAGIELDGTFAALCAAVQGDARRAFPTFGLALAVFPEAHWSALNPAASLRYWRLVDVEKGESLSSSPLRIDERVLHYLTGVFHLDERLWGLIKTWISSDGLVPSHQKIADRIVKGWSRSQDRRAWPVIQLHGNEKISKRDIAAAACRELDLSLFYMCAQSLPTNPADLETTLRLWSREAALSSSALLLEYDEADISDPVRSSLLDSIIDQARGAMFVSGRDRRKWAGTFGLDFEVKKPAVEEQHEIWAGMMKKAGYSTNGRLDPVIAQFNFDPRTIRAAGAEALRNNNGEDCSWDPSALADTLIWDACRKQSRPKLDDMAMRIESSTTWEDFVLPGTQIQILKNIAAHLRQRVRVYEQWGFAAKSTRGLGVSALFAGESGTGKTMAAEVLANELRLDLYRIDLSQVVSKYIGETEKNLRRVFDAAEDGGAILLFDEADALFGKRSEVKDSHDRYANIEISYLLQRMEAYRGLAILTTNMKNALDTAFLRRLRFIVNFPFPDAAQRAEIWQRIFPRKTPIEGLDFGKLARLNIAGGNIRNIALNAAFLAADAGEPVRMGHILSAARSEYSKIEKPLSSSEISGWQ